MPLAFFWGSAVCLDLSEVRFRDPDPDGTGWADHRGRSSAPRHASQAAGEQIRPGDIVLCWFDYGDRTYPEQRYTDQYPGMSYDAAEYLAQKGVVNIGTDCIALDNSLDTQFSTHMLCKQYGIVNTESLANLGQLINRRFTLLRAAAQPARRHRLPDPRLRVVAGRLSGALRRPIRPRAAERMLADRRAGGSPGSGARRR